MKRSARWAVAAAFFFSAAAPTGQAAESAPSLAQALTGNTLSGVFFIPHDAPNGGGSLWRIMFQAFLRPDGSALIRRWDPAHDAYATTVQRRWTVSGTTLCLDFPGVGSDSQICVDAHVWGPRIAGNGTGSGRFALLDGDIEPGNSLLASN